MKTLQLKADIYEALSQLTKMIMTGKANKEADIYVRKWVAPPLKRALAELETELSKRKRG
jgi:hypothetical protein